MFVYHFLVAEVNPWMTAQLDACVYLVPTLSGNKGTSYPNISCCLVYCPLRYITQLVYKVYASIVVAYDPLGDPTGVTQLFVQK